MSHFYGVLKGTRGVATRCGDKRKGLEVTAASWNGCISVSLYVDDQGRDCFTVNEERWQGHGVSRHIAEGVLGEKEFPAKPNPADDELESAED